MTEKEMLQNYAEAVDEIDRLEESLKEAKKRKELFQYRLIEALKAKEATSTAKYEGIGMLVLTKEKIKASVKKEDESLLFEFLRSNGYGDVIKETVHHGTLSTIAESIVSDNMPLPEFISTHIAQGVQFRKH